MHRQNKNFAVWQSVCISARRIWAPTNLPEVVSRAAWVVSALRGAMRKESVRTMENTTAAYGVYPDSVPAVEVVRVLNGAGFDNENICLMFAPSHPIASLVRDANILNQERETSALTAGLIGWLSEFGAVMIPSVGFFIRSHAFLHALLAARDAPALCGDSRTLAGLGFPEVDAHRFEEHLREAGFLVYVAALELAQVKWALELFRHTGAQESATLEREEERERGLEASA